MPRTANTRTCGPTSAYRARCGRTRRYLHGAGQCRPRRRLPPRQEQRCTGRVPGARGALRLRSTSCTQRRGNDWGLDRRRAPRSPDHVLRERDPRALAREQCGQPAPECCQLTRRARPTGRLRQLETRRPEPGTGVAADPWDGDRARQDGQGVRGRSRAGPRRTRLGALATRGDHGRFIEAGGSRCCNILDLRSGWPVGHWGSGSVVAPLRTIARGRATIPMLVERDAPLLLAAQGVAWLGIDATGKRRGTLAATSSSRTSRLAGRQVDCRGLPLRGTAAPTPAS